ncbi:hypothetical protein M9Y10_021545 [Tritrichomonas musculus]|uniref:SWIM-type domain-containing protein n=1 Tax=Tritrichomonas musculus TaxID=1915356 RepID=A0ABR2KPQ9_9EUKA
MDYGEIAFQEIIKQIEGKGVTHQNRMFLEVILPKQLIERTMKLIYQEAIIKYHCAMLSDRCFWSFNTRDKAYCVFCDNDTSFCTCPSYEKDVIQEGRYPFCKHILATYICNALRKKGEIKQFQIEDIDDDEFASSIAKAMALSLFGKKQAKI